MKESSTTLSYKKPATKTAAKSAPKVPRPLKLAVVGGGLNSVAGYTHFSASRMDQKFQVVTGVFSRKPDINQSTVEYWGIPKHYGNFEDLVANEGKNVDAFVVLLPVALQHSCLTTRSGSLTQRDRFCPLWTSQGLRPGAPA